MTCGPRTPCTKTLLGAKSKVSLTLTNQGTGDVNGWTVIMGLSGLTLALTIPARGQARGPGR